VHEPFDLAQRTAYLVEARQAEARIRAVTFHASISPAVATGHRELAERLVANLVDNALRYNRPQGWINVATWTAEGRGLLHVANTGTVVPPDAVDELFEPFRRLGTARTARADGVGLGLGLSIVRAIADAHDAELVARANPEGGLSITVAFPAAAESRA
jgi:signal transduction histidine kinase